MCPVEHSRLKTLRAYLLTSDTCTCRAAHVWVTWVCEGFVSYVLSACARPSFPAERFPHTRVVRSDTQVGSASPVQTKRTHLHRMNHDSSRPTIRVRMFRDEWAGSSRTIPVERIARLPSPTRLVKSLTHRTVIDFHIK